LPTEHLSGRHGDVFAGVHAWIAQLVIAGIDAPGRAGGIEEHEGVMDDLRVAGMEFDGADPARGAERKRDNEISIDILAGGREGVRLRHLHDQIRLAELPIVVP